MGKEGGGKSACQHFGENGEKKKNKTSAKSPCKSVKQQHFISRVSATKLSTRHKSPKSRLFFFPPRRLRCNHVSPHCAFITRCRSANGARGAKFLLSNLLRVQHQGQLLGRTLAKNISTFCGDLWRPHRLPYKLESPDNTGLCEMNYISPSVTTS